MIRVRVFALGRVADWRVTYRRATDDMRGYDITMLGDNIREVRITDEETVDARTTGVQIEVSELHREYRSLDPDNAVQELAEIFALYLKDYREVSIQYEGTQLDPATAIATTRTEQLTHIDEDGMVHPVELEIIEWRNVTTRGLYLCTERGFPLSKVTTRFHIGEFHFSAYLKSSFVTKLHGEAQLDLAEMNPLLNACIEEAQQAVKAYFRDRAAERARTVVEEWKAERGSSAESVGRIEVLLKEVWVGWGRSAGRRDKALAALGTRLPRTVGPGRQPAARVLRCAAVLRMTAATDRAGGPCGPAGRLALDRLAASATAERRSVVAEDRRKRPRTLDAGSAHARPGSCLTMTSSRRPHRRGDDPVPNDRTRPSQQNASRSGNPRQFGVGTPKRRGRRTGCNSRVS